jgi:hypothetical protein
VPVDAHSNVSGKIARRSDFLDFKGGGFTFIREPFDENLEVMYKLA